MTAKTFFWAFYLFLLLFFCVPASPYFYFGLCVFVTCTMSRSLFHFFTPSASSLFSVFNSNKFFKSKLSFVEFIDNEFDALFVDVFINFPPALASLIVH